MARNGGGKMTHQSPTLAMPVRADQFQALITLLHEISLQRSLRSIFVIAAEGARAILGAKCSAVRIFASGARAQGVTPSASQFRPNGISIDALISEIEEMTRPESKPKFQAGKPELKDQGKRSLSFAWLAVPLLDRDHKSIGWIRAWDKPSGPFTTEDETVLALVAQFLSLAIENDRLLECDNDINARWENEIRERKRLEEDLRQTQRIAAVGQLAGGIAHDFNNILTASLGYSELMMKRLDPASQVYPMAQCIRDVSLQAKELTRSLLGFSRQHVVEPHVVELNEVVSAVANMFQRLMGEDIALVRDFDPQAHSVRVNPYQMERALLNLIINACDAMEQRGGTLTLRTLNMELKRDFFRVGEAAMPGLWSLLEVSDTGSGMDQATMSHIFEPFFTTKAADRGNGLGLTMVAQTVKESDGVIRVQSKAGGGSCFQIYFPATDQRARCTSPPVITGRQCRGTETIMVVEDDGIVQRLLWESLTDQGYLILCAGDGLEALRIAKCNSGRIDLLLTDLVMLGMNGRALAEQFDQMGIASRFLFISGHPDKLVGLKVTRKFCYSCLAKPFTPRALVATVREILDREIAKTP